MAAGLLNRTETGTVEFPYDAVKVEFLLRATWQRTYRPGPRRRVQRMYYHTLHQ